MILYHVLNRGVDKRKIFLNDEDYKIGKQWYWGVKTAKGIVSVPAQKL